MAKGLWFKFFYGYRKAFEALPGWKCKRLILAIFDYMESGAVKKLDKKTQEYFLGIKTIIDADRELSKRNGFKGVKKRWGSVNSGKKGPS